MQLYTWAFAQRAWLRIMHGTVQMVREISTARQQTAILLVSHDVER